MILIRLFSPAKSRILGSLPITFHTPIFSNSNVQFSSPRLIQYFVSIGGRLPCKSGTFSPVLYGPLIAAKDANGNGLIAPLISGHCFVRIFDVFIQAEEPTSEGFSTGSRTFRLAGGIFPIRIPSEPTSLLHSQEAMRRPTNHSRTIQANSSRPAGASNRRFVAQRECEN